MTSKVLLMISSVCLVLASCSPIVDTRGYSQEAVDMRQLIIGQSKQEDVQALLGSPTARSTYGDTTWYYITTKKETVGVFAPEVTEQHVTAIRFNPDETVADIAEVKKEEGKPVQIVRKTTTTEGQSLTFMEQMLGNFGR